MKTKKVRQHTIEERPAGTAGAVSALLVLVATKLGVELSAADAAVIVGAVASIVSIFNPR